jgi:hypothetical protein
MASVGIHQGHIRTWICDGKGMGKRMDVKKNELKGKRKE